MFGESFDTHITMTQRVVALIRDLVLIAVVLLTVVITYFGGDPANLQAWDWSILVAWGFLIVLGPICAFFVIRWIFVMLNNVFFEPVIAPLFGTSAPRGLYAWFQLRVLRKSRREYIRVFRERRQHLNQMQINRPRLFRVFEVNARLSRLISRATETYYPYLVAIITALIVMLLFWRAVRAYIPH
jgi:hypothetical protein